MSFAVSFGDTLGVIGDNGAGKSTLLKILAGTLTPTRGEAAIQGRLAALLELGAGFHPEFTGLQNIYLNGSLLGLSKAEIREKQGSIVDFSELGGFIERPLKTYSSGMVVRLAFSIATSVDPDILIIDEALSVGDQYFQEKCIKRMLRFWDQGKIIIFCSHAMFIVNQLCHRTVWLDHGAVRMQGATGQVTAAYENHLREKSANAAERSETGEDSGYVNSPLWIRSIALNGQETPVELEWGADLDILLEFECVEERRFWVALGIRRNDDLICHAVSMARDFSRPLSTKGGGAVLLRYKALPLLQGEYTVVGSLLDEAGVHCYHRKESSTFCIRPSEGWKHEIGILELDHEWQIL